MHVTVWFDPGCPWCWNTSRWLESLVTQRSLDIEWRPFSLGLKNMDDNDDVSEQHQAAGRRNLRLLRLIEATRRAGHDDRIGDLYTELGRHIHHDDDPDVDPALAVGAIGLDPGLAQGTEDGTLDLVIRASMAEALALAGDDSGVPIVAFGSGPDRVGFFGPILTEVPTGAAAGALFDSLVGVATVPGFVELKRRRDRGPAAPERP
ncbi:MAG: DsbA family protein [Acidimicrobiales bacterium]